MNDSRPSGSTPAAPARTSTLRRAVDTFAARPGASLALAALVLAIAAIFLAGLLPSGRKYGAGHRDLMAGASVALAAFFAGCAVLGLRRRRTGRAPRRTR